MNWPLAIDLDLWVYAVDAWGDKRPASAFQDGNVTHVHTPWGRYEVRKVQRCGNILYVPYQGHVHVEECVFSYDENWIEMQKQALEDMHVAEGGIEVPIFTKDITMDWSEVKS